MKIDDLVKNLEQNTAEQDKNIKKQAERYQTALGKLQRLTTKKNLKQTESILEKSSNHRGTTAEHSKRFAFEYTQGGSFGRTGGDISHISRDNGMARQGNQSQATGASRNQPRAGRTPLENRILRMVEFHESEDKKAYFIVAKNAKKAEAYTTTGKDKVLKIER